MTRIIEQFVREENQLLLRRSEVEQLQGSARDFVCTLHDFLFREHSAIGILGRDVAARHANLRKHLRGDPLACGSLEERIKE